MGRSPPTPSRGRRLRAPNEGRCRADPHCTRRGRSGRIHHLVHVVARGSSPVGQVHLRPLRPEDGGGPDAPESTHRVPRCADRLGDPQAVDVPLGPVDRVARRPSEAVGHVCQCGEDQQPAADSANSPGARRDSPGARRDSPGAARAEWPGRHRHSPRARRVGTCCDVRRRRGLVGRRRSLQRRPRDHPLQLGRLRRTRVHARGCHGDRGPTDHGRGADPVRPSGPKRLPGMVRRAVRSRRRRDPC